ncbi:MAG: two-component sensor histidine kinase, partial [Eggerthella lenta]
VEDGRARLVVEDDGIGCGLSAFAAASGALPQAVDGEGHGIAGMAERVHLLGGTFSAGDRAGGGFRVVACLPMKGAEA